MRAIILLSLALLFISCEDDSGGISVDGNGNENENTDSTMTLFKAEGTGPESYFNDITEIFVDSKGRVWMGLSTDQNRDGQGMLMHENGTTIHVDTRETTGDFDFGGEVRQFAESADGTIWIAEGGGLCYYDEAAGEVKKHSSNFGGIGVHSVRKLSDGKVYAGTYNGRIAIIDESGNVESIELSANQGPIKDFELDNDGNLWIAGRFTLAKYDGENFTFYDTEAITGTKPENEEDEIYMSSIAKDDDGNLWFSDWEGYNKTYYWDGEDFELGHDFNETGVTTKVYRHYFNEGDYWIAGNGVGIIQVRNGSVLKEWNNENSGLPGNYVYSLDFVNNKVYFSSQFGNTGGWGYITLD